MGRHEDFLRKIAANLGNDQLRRDYADWLAKQPSVWCKRRASFIHAALDLSQMDEELEAYQSLYALHDSLLKEEREYWRQTLWGTMARSSALPVITFYKGLPYGLTMPPIDGDLGHVLEAVDTAFKVGIFQRLDATSASLTDTQVLALLSMQQLQVVQELGIAFGDCDEFPMTALASANLKSIRNLFLMGPEDEDLNYQATFDLEVLSRARCFNSVTNLCVKNGNVIGDFDLVTGGNGFSLQNFGLLHCYLDMDCVPFLQACARNVESLNFENSMSYLPRSIHPSELEFPRVTRVNLSATESDYLFDFSMYPMLQELEARRLAPGQLSYLLQAGWLDGLQKLDICGYDSTDLSKVYQLQERYPFIST